MAASFRPVVPSLSRPLSSSYDAGHGPLEEVVVHCSNVDSETRKGRIAVLDNGA